MVKIIARGTNINKAVNVASILIREWVINPEYNIKIDSEPFQNRYVSSIEITIKGNKKDKQ